MLYTITYLRQGITQYRRIIEAKDYLAAILLIMNRFKLIYADTPTYNASTRRINCNDKRQNGAFVTIGGGE